MQVSQVGSKNPSTWAIISSLSHCLPAALAGGWIKVQRNQDLIQGLPSGDLTCCITTSASSQFEKEICPIAFNHTLSLIQDTQNIIIFQYMTDIKVLEKLYQYSLELGLYFTLTAHLKPNHLHCKCSVATPDQWLCFGGGTDLKLPSPHQKYLANLPSA